jgi:hypothetical protein
MAKYKRWTTTEDNVVVDQVRQSPTNLTQAFERATREIDRTASACANHWYTVLSKDKANTCFVTVSGKHSSINRKNGKGMPCTQSIFTKILKILNIIK